jgi:hypothetical protein
MVAPPTEVSSDRAPAYLQVLDEVLPATGHIIEHRAASRSS